MGHTYTLDGSGDLLITPDTPLEELTDPVVDDRPRARGLVPRPLEAFPPGFYPDGVPPEAVQFPLVPESEVQERIRLKEETRSRLSDLRNTADGGRPFPSTDQGSRGYCWAHSCASAVMLLRAAQGDPYVGLSAYAVACVIKGYRDEGGWGAQAMDFICQRGIPSEAHWPMRAVDRGLDNPATWANAALHRVTAGFWDLAQAQWDRSLSYHQVVTCMLLNIPVVCDFNWWRHSVCGMDAVDGAAQRGRCRSGETGKLLDLCTFDRVWGMNDATVRGVGNRILNSWSDKWGTNGTAVLTGSRAVPDGSVAPRMTLPGPA